MIEITGRIYNVVDCGCYEIEAVPASAPREKPEDCGCHGQLLGGVLQEGTSRVRVKVDHTFAILVEDAQLKEWFAGEYPWFNFRVYLNGEPKLINRRRSPVHPDR